jgi:hypothetical protein
MRGVADREFSIVQTRPGFGPGGSDERAVLGTGVDHGDGTATVTPAEGLPRPRDPEQVAQRVSVADLTEGHHRFTVELVYADQE